MSDTRSDASVPLPSEVQDLAKALGDRYAIEREIGRGGMATVYLARDLRHDRRVALKVLNADLGAVLGAERFLAEIRVTANLQHPNLLPLFDSGGADGKLFYVMPYVEGESLRARLTRDKQLPVDEALRITTAVAGALDYAHQHGVVHRDLKPENILIHGGQAVVADFGIALAVSNAGGTRVTQTGISLGTPQYMSPEQATGDRTIDGRSDLYSLAAVTYEMLTGEPPHSGTTSQSIIAKLLTDTVRPITLLRRSVPPHVDEAVRRALEKLPADRFATANEFASALGASGAAGGNYATTATSAARRWRPTALIVAGAVAVFVAGALVASAVLAGRGTSVPAPERHFNLVLPDSLPVAVTGEAPLGIWQRAIAISRDGRSVAYVARTRGENRLVVLGLDDARVAVIPGSEGAFSPFFSPDGKWVAFFAGTDVRKALVAGGQSVTLASDMYIPVGGMWPSPDRIVVTRNEGRELIWLPAAGGKQERVDSLGPRSNGRLMPYLLPGGKAALAHEQDGLLVITLEPRVEVYAITRRGLVPVDSNRAEQIVGHSPVYVGTGHIVYASPSDGGLLALPFDAKTLEVLGPPVPVLDGVRKEQTYYMGQYAIADDGTFAYLPGGNGDFGYLAMAGGGRSIDTLPYDRAIFQTIHLDGKARRAYARMVDATGAGKTVTLDLVAARIQDLNAPIFQSTVIYRVFADGIALVWDRKSSELSLASLETGAAQPLPFRASGWPDMPPRRDRVLISKTTVQRELHSLAGDTSSMALSDDGDHSRFSPDGRWLAYRRSADGVIAVSPIPPTGAVIQVSPRPAEQPRWSASGDKLYFRFGRRIWSTTISTSSGFEVGPMRLELEAPLVRIRGWSYDVAPDGRLLVVLGSPEESLPHVNIITGFGARLKRLAPPK